MRFFEAQRLAKRNTFWLTILFGFNAIVISSLNAGIAWYIVRWERLENPMQIPKVVFLVSVVILFLSAVFFMMTVSNGSSVAEDLGGELISNTKDENEKKLMNIIEEMSIASGVPMPYVYVMNSERTINAFAAGANPTQMVIAVTRGAIEHLNRDELQAVIGHEYSHILNEDMLLNIRLSGVVMGFQVFVKIGDLVSDSRRMALIGYLLMAFGAFGYFLGRVLQSIISREREFLADAASAQFTRNPQALASALGKITTGCGSVLHTSNRHQMAHIFFSDAVFSIESSLFSTHPPVRERIERLVPGRKIEDIITEVSRQKKSLTADEAMRIELKPSKVTQLTEMVHTAGQPSALSLVLSQNILQHSSQWMELLKDLDYSRLALALMTFRSQANYESCIPFLKKQVSSLRDFEALKKLIEKDDTTRVAIYYIALGHLRILSWKEKQEVLQNMKETFLQDEKLSFLEALLFLNAEKTLLPALHKPVSTRNLSQAQKSMKELLENPEQVVYESLSENIKTFNRMSLAQKKKFLDELSPLWPLHQREEFRLFSLALQIPIPLQ